MSQKIIRFAWILGITLALLWLLMEYGLPIGLPFLLGLVLARAAEPATKLLQRSAGFSRSWAVAISVSGMCLFAATVLFLPLGFLWRQMQQLLELLPQLETTLQQGSDLLRSWLQSLSHRLPSPLAGFINRLAEQLYHSGSTIAEQAISLLPKLATGVLSGLSQGMLGLVTGIISAYMIAARLPKWQAWWQRRQMPQWQETWLPALSQLKKAMGGWIFAEFKLACVAFGILLLGFWLLRIQNPLLWAGLITLVDIFPVLGVGTVLLPWAGICFLFGNGARGVGLLAVYAVVWLTRSILEPKLVGKGLGLDPLLTLMATYAGWKLWGIAGLLLAPILTLATMQLFQQLKQ